MPLELGCEQTICPKQGHRDARDWILVRPRLARTASHCLNERTVDERTVRDAAQLSFRGRVKSTRIPYNYGRGGEVQAPLTEEVMKAVLALCIIYVGTFFIVVQGASQNSVQAAPQGAVAAQGQAATASIDPVKEADIRSLMELVGARDLVQDAAAKGTEQFRENLVASLPGNERGQKFVNAFVTDYQKRFNPDEVTGQLVAIYDKHFSEDDIKTLLQFYGSPLGQKFAAEMPKISAESQVASRAVIVRVAKDVLQDLRKQYPGMASQARLVKARPGQAEQAKQPVQTQSQNQADASQP
jgi:hypothetical protein